MGRIKKTRRWITKHIFFLRPPSPQPPPEVIVGILKGGPSENALDLDPYVLPKKDQEKKISFARDVATFL